MICPATKTECHMEQTCRERGCGTSIDPECGMTIDPPCEPTLAEFERLVDVFGEAVQSLCHFDECGTGYGRPELEVERDAARADLIDFARRMGVE